MAVEQKAYPHPHVDETWLGRLREETIREVRVNCLSAWRFEKFLKILHFFFQQFPVGQKLERSEQRDRAIQLEEHLQCVGDVRLCLAFEESLVAALTKTGRRIHDEFGVGAKGDAAVAG